jgi:polyisoprenoid-binding protein YceI
MSSSPPPSPRRATAASSTAASPSAAPIFDRRRRLGQVRHRRQRCPDQVPHHRQAANNQPQPPKTENHHEKKLATLSAALRCCRTGFAAPETLRVDGTHTFPRFSYSHFGYSTQLSRFNKTTGKVVLDKAAKTGSVDIVIDTKSVDTGYDTFNEHIQGEDFLDTAKYPTATFKSTKVVFEGDKPAKVEGNLTLKGVTKPVTLTVTSFQAMPHPMLKKDAIGANAPPPSSAPNSTCRQVRPNVGDEVTHRHRRRSDQGIKHKDMLTAITKAIKEVQEGKTDVFSVLRYVEYWFERHITEEDQNLARNLQQVSSGMFETEHSFTHARSSTTPPTQFS